MSALFRRLVPALLSAAILVVAPLARADKVAVLDFASGGSTTTSAQLGEAHRATRDAVLALRHTLPTEGEMLTAHMAVKDGVADTSSEYRAAGRAASATWTVAGHVDAHGTTYRLELEVCQVETGRVESLAREIDGGKATPEIGEMLALLVRPEGIGSSEPPWEHAQAPAPVAPPPAAAVGTPPSAPAPVVASPPVEAVPPPVYAQGLPFAVGVGVGALGALHRAANARGSATAGVVGVSGSYAIAAVRGLELRADLDAGVLGPHSLSLDVGARWVTPIARRARIFAGPEAALGAFFALGGDRSARVLLHGGLAFVWAASDRVQLEVVPEVDYAGGGSGSLVLGGALARVALRF